MGGAVKLRPAEKTPVSGVITIDERGVVELRLETQTNSVTIHDGPVLRTAVEFLLKKALP